MPVRTTRDYIALAKARPGEILYGSAGIGAFQHLAMSTLGSTIGAKLTHVPYKGGTLAVTGMMGGEIQAILTPIAELYAHLKSNRVRPIAVSSDARTTQFPEILAIAETVKGFEFTTWTATFVPAGTPRPIVDKIRADVAAIGNDPAFRKKQFTDRALEPILNTPEEFSRFLVEDRLTSERVVKEAGLQPQ